MRLVNPTDSGASPLSLLLCQVLKTRVSLTNSTEADARHSRPPSKHVGVYFSSESLRQLERSLEVAAGQGVPSAWLPAGSWAASKQSERRPGGADGATGRWVCCCTAPQTASSADLFYSALRLNTAVTSLATAHLVIAVTKRQICPNL